MTGVTSGGPQRRGLEQLPLRVRLPVDPNSGQRAQFEVRRALVSSLLVLAACGHGAKPPEIAPVVEMPDAVPLPAPVVAPPAVPDRAPLIAPEWPLDSRVRAVQGAHAMVVTSHALASGVGLDILRRGGNAVDAAVAVAFALTVVHPVAGNIGGGGFMVIRTHDDTVRTLDFREAAPSGATRSMYVDSAGDAFASSLTRQPSVCAPGGGARLVAAPPPLRLPPWT